MRNSELTAFLFVFVAMQAVDTVSKKTVRNFLMFHLKAGQNVCTDAFPALNAVAESHFHEKKVTPPRKCIGMASAGSHHDWQYEDDLLMVLFMGFRLIISKNILMNFVIALTAGSGSKSYL